ncbi:MAG TPA: Pr6Pr family membrane protein [Jiangellaceae bacterium]|nr:Pr6Pr family membrane protein [Jiangellaceae bacterium]
MYIAYTLIRSPFITYTQASETRHWYPFHFINVDDLGYGRTLINIVGLLVLMLAVAGAYLVLDRTLPEWPRSAAS